MYHSFAPYEQDLREWWASHIYPDVNPFTHDFLLHITRPDAPFVAASRRSSKLVDQAPLHIIIWSNPPEDWS
jgi:hypothetical protein